MLVCNVSLRPRRTAIAVEVVEAITATDATATGNIVFATLVDDPASVADRVDAFLGEIMLEVANAADAADAGLVYIAGIDEALTAIAAQDGAVPAIYTDAVAETVTAAALVDASAVSAAAVTTTGAVAVGPLFVFDTTFPSSSLTVINAGR